METHEIRNRLNEIKESNSSIHPDRASKKTVDRLIDVCTALAFKVESLEDDVDQMNKEMMDR